MKKRVKAFLREEDGQDLVEYALAAGLVIGGIVAIAPGAGGVARATCAILAVILLGAIIVRRRHLNDT